MLHFVNSRFFLGNQLQHNSELKCQMRTLLRTPFKHVDHGQCFAFSPLSTASAH